MVVFSVRKETQLPDVHCCIQKDVLCQTETSRPELELHGTLFHYAENTLYSDSSPAYQSFSLNARRILTAATCLRPLFMCLTPPVVCAPYQLTRLHLSQLAFSNHV